MSGNGVRTTELTVRFPHTRCSWGPAILKAWRDDHTYSTKAKIKEKQRIFDILQYLLQIDPPPFTTHQQIQKLLTFTETAELLTFPHHLYR